MSVLTDRLRKLTQTLGRFFHNQSINQLIKGKVGTVDDRYRRIEEQQAGIQESLQKMAGAMADVLRMVAAGREENLGAVSDDTVRRLTGPEGDWKGV